jgi:hypothetical protein
VLIELGCVYVHVCERLRLYFVSQIKNAKPPRSCILAQTKIAGAQFQAVQSLVGLQWLVFHCILSMYYQFS